MMFKILGAWALAEKLAQHDKQSVNKSSKQLQRESEAACEAFAVFGIGFFGILLILLFVCAYSDIRDHVDGRHSGRSHKKVQQQEVKR